MMAAMTSSPKYPYRPDWALPPGETLLETIDEMGLSAADLCERSGLSEREVAGIIHGTAILTAETARALEQATGVPARLWEGLEREYRAALERVARPAG